MKRIYFLTTLLIFFAFSPLSVFASDYIVTAAEDADLGGYGLKVISENLGMFLADEDMAKLLLERGEASSISEDKPLVIPDTSDYKESMSFKSEVTAMAEYNDPYFSDQVYFDQCGITEYINTYKPSGKVRIGVIDTGVNRNHQEFVNADIEVGYNFITNSTDTEDTFRHGTMVTGILVAGRNDGIGMAGIVPDATIVPLVAMTNINGETQGTSSNMLSAIMAAVDTYDCDIITTSLGVTSGYGEINKAVEYANSKGVIVIAAAGNSGSDSDSSVASALCYPASSPGAISVGATDKSFKRASYSQKNYRINVVACGGLFRMPGISSDNAYVMANGTSFSAPVVAGITALFLSEHPDMTPDDYLSILEGGALYLNEDYTGEGIPDCMQMEYLYSMPDDEICYMVGKQTDNTQFVLKLFTKSDLKNLSLVLSFFSDGKYSRAKVYDSMIFNDGICHYEGYMTGDAVNAFALENLESLTPISEVYEYRTS